jgi:nitrogen-specific signal transduction histidine kinase
VLQVIVAHRNGAGEVEFLSTIARDIRERKQAEEELQRDQTMAALGSLVAGVAHEVRNPLFGISSTLDAFEARFAGRTDHRPYVAVFREQLDRLTSLMNDLLEYAKPGGGELAYSAIEPVVEHALRACSPIAARAQVLLESRIAPGLPALRMDAKRMSQVFRNLVENGVQHSPAGGRGQRRRRRRAPRRRDARRVRGRGQGPRLPSRGPAPPVRAVLHPPPRRHRARAVDRLPDRDRPRRHDRGAQPPGRRRVHHRGAAGGVAPFVRRGTPPLARQPVRAA